MGVARANTNPPVYAEGQNIDLSTDLSGSLRVSASLGGIPDETPFVAGTTEGSPLMGVITPSDTPASGDLAVVALAADRSIKVSGSFSATPVTSSTASAPAQTTVGTTASQILAANALRKTVMIQNTGTTVIKIVLGAATPTQTAFHFSLPAGGTAQDGSSPTYISNLWIGAIQAISSAAGGTVTVTELT